MIFKMIKILSIGLATLVCEPQLFGNRVAQRRRRSSDQQGDAARSESLVGGFFDSGASELTGALLDGLLNIVLGHVLGLGAHHRLAQPRIHVDIASAFTRSNCDLVGKLAEELAALGIEGALGTLNSGPFTMT